MIEHAAAAAASILVASYSPPQIDVVAGDTVTWTNDSVRKHTVSAQDGSWSSPEVFAGDRFAHGFDRTGAFAYYCRIHPFMRGMFMVVN
jgi:plastocyanin